MNRNSKLEQLVRILSRETELYRSMQDVLDREKDAAVKSDINLLLAAAGEKEHLIADIHQEDVMRRQLVEDLALDLGIAERGVTLTAISQAVDEPFAGRLERANAEFSSILKELQTANDRNRQLVEHCLALLKGSINMLSDLLAPGVVYHRTGNIGSSKSTGKCISSEI